MAVTTVAEAAARQHGATRSGGRARPAAQGLVGGLGGGGAYANCSAVRAAGAAPIRAGQPGYARKLDRDGDGVGCE